MPYVFRTGFGPYRSRLARARLWIGTATAGAITGTAACTLPSITASAAGAQTYSGTIAATLPSLTAAATGAQTHSGNAALTLLSLTVAAVGDTTVAAVWGSPRFAPVSPLGRRKTLIPEPEPAIATFFAFVDLRLREGRPRIQREADGLALLGLGDVADDEEALLGLR